MLERLTRPSVVKGIDRWSLLLVELAVLLLDLLLLTQGVALAVGVLGVLIPPLRWLPPASDSVRQPHPQESRATVGGSKLGWASVLSPERPLCRSCCTSGHGSNRIRPIGSVAFCREGRRYRSGDCCLRVRSRPRKRRPPQGGGARLLVDPRRAGHRPPFEDDPRRRGGAHCRARAGCGGNRGVVRRRRRPHRALRRAGTRRRARRGRQRGSRPAASTRRPASSRRSAATAVPRKRRCSGW